MFVRCLSVLAIVLAGLFAAPQAANAKVVHSIFGDYEDGVYPARKIVKVKKFKSYATHVKAKRLKHIKSVKLVKVKKQVVALKKSKKPYQKILIQAAGAGLKIPPTVVKQVYKGRQEVGFLTSEKPGTLIIKTQERALYKVLPGGKAMRYLVAVGKEGFSWAGVARVGSKRVNPPWTPPAEMIARKPELAKWAGGMAGGVAENPLGPRAMYLYRGKYDTGFRIHGTIHPESIGTAASSGCIRMLNNEVIELFAQTRVGTKVIVL